MTARRGLLVAIGCSLLGASLLLAATAQPWVRATSRAPAPTVGRPDAFLETATTYDAADTAPAATALGLAALASVAALAGTRGAARRAVGAVVAVIGSAGVAAAARVAREPGRVANASGADVDVLAAPWVAIAGGALVAVAGALTVVHGPRWGRLGSAYDAPPSDTGSYDGREQDDADLWEMPDEERR